MSRECAWARIVVIHRIHDVPRRGDDMIRGLLLRVLLTLAVPSVHVAAQTLTFTNTTIVDVSDGTLRRGMTVIVEGNRMNAALEAAVASRANVRIQRGVEARAFSAQCRSEAPRNAGVR